MGLSPYARTPENREETGNETEEENQGRRKEKTKMKLYISSCNVVKSGESNGRKWTLYQIQDPKGTKYSTFEAKYVGMVGQEVDVVVEEKAVEKNGRSFLNRTIIEPKRAGVAFDAS